MKNYILIKAILVPPYILLYFLLIIEILIADWNTGIERMVHFDLRNEEWPTVQPLVLENPCDIGEERGAFASYLSTVQRGGGSLQRTKSPNEN